MNKIRAIKKIKRKCMVRGCKNKETYSVSCSTELGNSIHICEECTKGILCAIAEKYPTEPKAETKKNEISAEDEAQKPKKPRKKAVESGE